MLFDKATRLGSYGTGLVARHFAGDGDAHADPPPGGDAGLAPPLLPADPIELRLEFPAYVITSRLAPWRIQFPYSFRLLDAQRIFTEGGIATDIVSTATSFAGAVGGGGMSAATLRFAYAPVEPCQDFDSRWLKSLGISSTSRSKEALLPGSATYTGSDSGKGVRMEITLSPREGSGCAAFILVGAPGVFEANRVSYLDFIKSFSDFSAAPPVLQQPGNAWPYCPTGQHRFQDACVTDPLLVHKVQPDYPKKARKKKLDGQVELKAVIQIDGSVGSLEVQKCTHPGVGFEEAAMAAVRQWRYTTPMMNNWPIKEVITIVITFQLHPAKPAPAAEPAAGATAPDSSPF
jgi:TonB family protein